MRASGPVGAVLLAALVGCTSGGPEAREPRPAPSTGTAAPHQSGARALAEQRSELETARRHLKHIVFIVKENRTLDTLFGRFPGADGATEGRTCDGRTVRLRRARDEEPDVEHHFVPAARAMDGGRMDCFDTLSLTGDHLQSSVQYRRSQIPSYWALARHYTLADRFFSSIYGPTGVEHLWTLAGQSDRFVDQERPDQYGSGAAREYCDDPSERAFSFRKLTAAQDREV